MGSDHPLGSVEMLYSKACKAQWRCVRSLDLISSKVALRDAVTGETYSGPLHSDESYHCTTMQEAIADRKLRVDGAITCDGECDVYGWVKW